MHKLQRLSWILAAFLASIPIAERIVRAAETAAINDEAVDRMIDLNKKAFADIQSSRFDAARYRLEEALVVGETAGLEHDEMTARTRVHIAVVYLTGFKNREEAVQQLRIALGINPTITLTVGLETPALKSAYLLARKQMGLPPNPDANLAPSPSLSPSSPDTSESPEFVLGKVAASEVPVAPPENATGAKPTRGDAMSIAGISDPDLPARIRVPIYCPLPFEIPPGEDLVVRCLTRKHHKQSSATLYYRREGATGEDYNVMAMDLSAKGWLVGIIPGNAISGKALSYYVQARIAGSQEVLSLGRPDAPNSFIIKEGARTTTQKVLGSTAHRTGATIPFEEAARVDRGESGAIWISLGGGSGVAYHQRETVDSGAPIPVRAGFSPAGLFQIEPEVGYRWNEKLSLSVMGRYQYSPKDADGYVPGLGGRDILTSALAAFVRARFAFLSQGKFQTQASGGLGFGTSFLANVKKQCSDSSCTLNHGDTLHGGPLGLMVGVGAIYHVSPTVGLFIDVNEVATLPKFMALTEVNLGVALTYHFAEPSTSRAPKNTDL